MSRFWIKYYTNYVIVCCGRNFQYIENSPIMRYLLIAWGLLTESSKRMEHFHNSFVFVYRSSNLWFVICDHSDMGTQQNSQKMLQAKMFDRLPGTYAAKTQQYAAPCHISLHEGQQQIAMTVQRQAYVSQPTLENWIFPWLSTGIHGGGEQRPWLEWRRKGNVASAGRAELWDRPTSVSWIGASSHQSYID